MSTSCRLAGVAGLLLGIAVASRAEAQPRPIDAEPLDYLPPPVTTPSAPVSPQLPAVSGSYAAPGDLPAPLSLPAGAAPPAPSYRSPSSRLSPGPRAAASPVDLSPEISPNANKARYIWHGGRWWYLQPSGRWQYWSEGRWVEYQASPYAGTPPSIQPPGNARRWRRMVSGTAGAVY